jgi:hypothetical protein
MSPHPIPGFTLSFDESMILFHNVVEILDEPQFSSFSQSLIGFKFVNRWG